MNTSPSQPPSQLTPHEVGTPQSPKLPSPSLRSLRLCGAALWLFALSSLLFAAQPPELTVLRQQYEKVYSERVTNALDASKAALDAKFTTALDNAIITAKGAGNLPAVLAIQEDKKCLTDKQPLPADDEKTPESLKKLRAIYREQLANLTEQKTANATTLLTPYAAKLQVLEATLTKNDRVEEAKEVMDYRASLKADAPPASPLVKPEAADKEAVQANSAMAPKGDKPSTENERLTAIWVLSLKGELVIIKDGAEMKPTSEAELPEGEFQIKTVVLNGSKLTHPVVSADMGKLADLKELQKLQLEGLDLVEADIKAFHALPRLFTLAIGGIKLTPAGVEALPVFNAIKQINLTAPTEDTMTVFEELIEKFPNLNELQFIGPQPKGPAIGEALAPFAKLSGLSRIRFFDWRFGDDALATVAAFPRMGKDGSIGIRANSVTPQAVQAVQKQYPKLKISTY